MTASRADRPRLVDVAFWCWVAGALMFIAGGLIAATVRIEGFPLVVRIAGIFAVLIGALIAFLAGRTRNGDVRFRRALIALSLALVVIVGLGTALGLLVVHFLTLLGLVPLIAGTACITRPVAAAWFTGDQEPVDG
jgi:hypothetical protein